MTVAEIVTLFPGATPILAEYGLHCSSCAIGGVETLEQGCKAHGYGDEDVDLLLGDLNTAMAEAPQKAASITLTEPAAHAIQKIAQREGKEAFLKVLLNAQGEFCMEFSGKPEERDHVFTNENVPNVTLFCSSATLFRLGGSTIDFREERFKLDVPESKHTCSCHHEDGVCRCKKGESCGC